MALVEVKVPDIGDFDEVAVIELMVKVGDTIKAEQSLITVESDKAAMEIPSSTAGVVKELRVKLGDKVKQGSVVLVVEAAGAAAAPAVAPAAAVAAPAPAAAPSAAPAAALAPAASGPVQVHVPNIGDFKDVAVIEVMVKPNPAPSPHKAAGCMMSGRRSLCPPAATIITPTTPTAIPKMVSQLSSSPSSRKASKAPCIASVFAKAVPAT